MADKKETPTERFVRIAGTRTEKIIDMIRLLGNCSNSYVYEYSPEAVEKIFSAIEDELNKAKKKYGGIGAPSDKLTYKEKSEVRYDGNKVNKDR